MTAPQLERCNKKPEAGNLSATAQDPGHTSPISESVTGPAPDSKLPREGDEMACSPWLVAQVQASDTQTMRRASNGEGANDPGGHWLGHSRWNRREWLKLAAAFGAASTLPLSSCASRPLRTQLRQGPTDLGFSPVDRSLPDRVGTERWSGDQPEEAHRHFLGGAGRGLSAVSNAPVEEVNVAIVGGGMSGLLSAYWLKDLKPIVLEQAPRLGGYSRGESWRGLDYSIGAAYITPPEKGSRTDKLFQELGISKLGKSNQSSDPVLLKGKLEASFWEGGTDAAHHQVYEKYSRYLKQLLENQGGLSYPNIPGEQGDVAADVLALDRVDLKSHLVKVLVTSLPPQLEEAIELYCWSSFGARASEVSAASGLNFLAGEANGTVVFPGGNSAITEALARHLVSALPEQSLRTSSTVMRITAEPGGVRVQYRMGSFGSPRTLRAKKVIFAAPKFIAAHVIEGLEAERLAAIKKLRYRGYLVANALLKSAPEREFYDMYLLKSEKAKGKVRTPAWKEGATDVTRADFALLSTAGDGTQGAAQRRQGGVTPASGASGATSSSPVSGLTLYRSIPWEGARGSILDARTLEAERTQLVHQLESEILPSLGGGRSSVHEVRMTRWGHALPVASPGHLSQVCPKVRAPFRNQIYFVHQDNWALPAFETCVAESLHWSDRLRQDLV